MNPNGVVKLIKVIGVLALPAAGQTRCLELMGVAPLADELALELRDQVLLVDQFVESGYLASEEAEAIRRLDALLAGMSGPDNAALWTTDALATRSEWESVRSEAREFLCRL